MAEHGDTLVEACRPLPEVFSDLDCGFALIEAPLPVTGTFALEILAGEAIFTLGLMMAKVPCIQPLALPVWRQF